MSSSTLKVYFWCLKLLRHALQVHVCLGSWKIFIELFPRTPPSQKASPMHRECGRVAVPTATPLPRDQAGSCVGIGPNTRGQRAHSGGPWSTRAHVALPGQRVHAAL